MMRRAAREWGGWCAGSALVLLSGVSVAQADDVTTLSGTTFHQVRAVRVEPDGVTWEHATGMVKVDFADLPDAVRRAYHYDAGKAAAFAAAQAASQVKAAAQIQQTQREAAARRAQQYQAQSAATGANPGEFVARRSVLNEAAVQSLGEGITAKKQAEAFRIKDDGTIWDRRLWAVPKLIFGGNEFDGVAFDPKTDFKSHEFQSSLHHSAVSDVKDSANDAFFQPIYLTKSYNDGVDRAAAFARGRP